MTAPIILPWKGKTPKIADDAFIAPGAVIIGDVEIGSRASIWFGCVLRGDVNFIRVGARTNIQDGTVVHVDSGRAHVRHPKVPAAGHPTIIGDGVTIGHMAMIHGCTCESGSFIGLRATLMDGVVVEGDAMVAAGALVSPFKRIARNQLWIGTPAKFSRNLTPEELSAFPETADYYAMLGETYRAQLGR